MTAKSPRQHLEDFEISQTHDVDMGRETYEYLRTLLKQAVDGWVMVPREPTKKMIGAYIKCVPHSCRNKGLKPAARAATLTEKCQTRWKAMIAASE